MMSLCVSDVDKSMCIVAFGDSGVAAMYKKACKYKGITTCECIDFVKSI
jgi:hypothetical protein